MSTADATPIREPLPTTTETRIAAYLLTDYLERLGVEVVFGLCGHTVIALLDALGKSRIRFVSTRHEQVAAHAADGYARATGKPGVLLTHLGPGPDQRRDRRRQRRARFDSDGRDRRRRPVVLLRPPSASGSQPPPGRRPVPDLPAVLQARLPRRPRRATCRASWSARSIWRRPAGPGPVLVDVPMDIFSADLPVDAFQQDAAPRSRGRRSTRRPPRGSSTRWRAPSVRCSTPAAACSRRARPRELAALAEALEVPVAHTLMGKGCLPRGSSAAARADRLLGHADRQREVPAPPT